MIDHTGHAHPKTPAARALCRKLGGTSSKSGKIDSPAEKKAVAKKAAVSNVSREEAAKIMFGAGADKLIAKKPAKAKKLTKADKELAEAKDRLKRAREISARDRADQATRLAKAKEPVKGSPSLAKGNVVKITSGTRAGKSYPVVEVFTSVNGTPMVVLDIPNTPEGHRQFKVTSVQRVDKDPAGGLSNKRVAGTDQNKWVLNNAVHLVSAQRGNWRTDTSLTEIARKQGWHGSPRVTTRAGVDEAIAAGAIQIFRGVRSDREGKGSSTSTPASEFLDRLRGDGEWEVGTGIYGNGTYFSVDRKTSLVYAGKQDKGVIRGAVGKDAKIVEYPDLLKEQRQWLTDFEDEHSDIFRGVPADFADENSKWARVNTTRQLMQDSGRFAAMRGYDVVHMVGEHDGVSTADQYVILNRTVLILEDEP